MEAPGGAELESVASRGRQRPILQRYLGEDILPILRVLNTDLPGRNPSRDPRARISQILIHLPAREAETRSAQELGEALARFFAYRADVLGRDLNELLRIGRRSLLIGLSDLGLCLVAGKVVTGRFDPDYVGRFIEEGLIIVGWVANWRPIEIFIYDWWVLARWRDLYRRLAKAPVTLRPMQASKDAEHQS